jgi:predicted Zn-dependent protease
MLEASGRVADAVAAINEGSPKTPTRPDLYRNAASFLIANHRLHEASRLLDQAARVLPDNPDILLLRDNTAELIAKPKGGKSPDLP